MLDFIETYSLNRFHWNYYEKFEQNHTSNWTETSVQKWYALGCLDIWISTKRWMVLEFSQCKEKCFVSNWLPNNFKNNCVLLSFFPYFSGRKKNHKYPYHENNQGKNDVYNHVT